MDMLLQGLAISITPVNLLACVIGVLLGTITGILPGIGPLGAIALLLPLSLKMDAVSSLIMFSGIFYGAMYAGSTTSILLNVPGESASVVTCLDGYAMAKKGRAGAALAVAAIGSFIAGTMGLIGLTFFVPVLADLALRFGPPEYFAIAALGLIILTKLVGHSGIKSALMVVLGIILGTVGLDGLTGISRFTFTVNELQRGLDFTVVVMGLFGMSEVLEAATRINIDFQLKTIRFRELYPNKEELRRSIAPIFRGGVIGFLTGLIPGPAAVVSTFISYAAEKKCSKYPEKFGQGAIEGVAGPEAANNAAAMATMIPLLALGLPFAPASAVLLSGFMLHGIIPGPTLATEHADIFWGLIASMYIGNVLLLVINLPMVGLFASILKIPINILMPVVAIFTITGAYAINNSFLDVLLLIAFGVLGFIMKHTDYEPAPLVIGLILGPRLEEGLVQGLILGNGEFSYFFIRPISNVLLSLGVIFILYNLFEEFWNFRKYRKGERL